MLRFIDCNCVVGLPVSARGFRLCDPAGIERVSRDCGVAGVFAHHCAAFDLHPIDGNDAIDRVCAKNSFFRPVWVLIPNDTGEFYDAESLTCRMKQHNIRLARVFPRYNDHGFSLAQWSAGPLFAVLAHTGIPLLIDADQTDWDGINELMETYPEITVIVTNIYYRYARYILPLLKRHKNLYCETSGLRSFSLLQSFCETAGADCLVFGTGMGLYSAGSAVAMVTYAGISQIEKEAIACDNLCRILKTDRDDL